MHLALTSCACAYAPAEMMGETPRYKLIFHAAVGENNGRLPFAQWHILRFRGSVGSS